MLQDQDLPLQGSAQGVEAHQATVSSTPRPYERARARALSLSQSSSQSGRVRSCARLRAEGVLRPSPPRTREKREISDGRRAGVAKLGGPVAELRRETGTRVNVLEMSMKIPEELRHAFFFAIAAGSL